MTQLYKLETIKHIFENPNWVNNHYMPNMILISSVIGEFDIVLYGKGGYGVYNDFSEFINGKIAGSIKYNSDYYGIVSFRGDVWEDPEWYIIDWDYIDNDNIQFKDKNKGWFIIGESTNYKMVKSK